jgi:adenosylcobinamide-phosphate synthase
MTAAALAGGYAADVLLGDPRRFHPVAGFGRVAQATEKAAYSPSRVRGAIYAGGLVAAAGVAGELLARTRLGRGPALAVTTWAALGGRSLVRTGGRVADHLERGDIDSARGVIPSLCGRDPESLDEPEICRATVESLAENTADAVVGPLFWGAVAGPGGVAAYRAANTLDAMVGNRSDRYRDFGWGAAKLDDAMNWPVARLTARLTSIVAPVAGGSALGARQISRRDGADHPSPNAGRVEASFAGALGIRLGGPLSYDGVVELRPSLGDGQLPGTRDIRRAARLSVAVGAAATAAAVALRSLR